MKEEAMITKNQLHAFSESFRKLSQSFEVDVSPRGALNDQEMQDIFNAVTEQVCKDCSRCSYCWENVFEDSCESAYEILKLCSERVNMKKKDLPERFRQRCVRSDNFLAEARRMMAGADESVLAEPPGRKQIGTGRPVRGSGRCHRGFFKTDQ